MIHRGPFQPLTFCDSVGAAAAAGATGRAQPSPSRGLLCLSPLVPSRRCPHTHHTHSQFTNVLYIFAELKSAPSFK